MTAIQGAGPFQWNKGGWFGSIIGSTAYLVLLGPFLAFDSLLPGMAVLACGLVPNIVAYAMWRRRDRLLPYPALQRMMLLLFVCTAIALGVAMRWEHAQPTTKGLGATGKIAPQALLLFPALMLLFRFRERAGRARINTAGDGQSFARSRQKTGIEHAPGNDALAEKSPNSCARSVRETVNGNVGLEDK